MTIGHRATCTSTFKHFFIKPFGKCKWSVFILPVILLLAVQPLRGDFSQRFRHLSLSQGLSHGSVYSIVQDNTGYMWFGTEDGLCRFDGYHITVYRKDPSNPNSLSSGDLSKIWIDASGIMWLGTWGGGLNKYDPATDRFTHYLHDPGNAGSISGNRVESLLVDRKGRLWIGTENNGLNRLDDQKGIFIRYRHQPENPSSLSDDSVKTIYEDRQGNIWIGTNAGINRYNEENGSFTHLCHENGNPASLSDNRVRSIMQDHNGLFWIGTRGGGLNRFDGETGIFKVFQPDPKNPASISDHSITQVFEDSSGILWIGTYNGGLNRLDPVKESFSHFKHNPQDSRGLSHNRVETIFEDRGKMLWLGTRGGGINMLDLKPDKFTAYHYHPDSTPSLPHPSIQALIETESGDGIWMGTDGQGVSLYHSSTGQYTHYRHDRDNPGSLSDNRVRSLLLDKKAHLWAGTYNGGLNEMTGNGFKRYTHDPAIADSLSNNRVHCLLQDRDGDIWAGTNLGLNLLERSKDPETGSFRRFYLDAQHHEGLSGNYISSLVQDPYGFIWIGTANGLHKMDKATWTWQSYFHQPGEKNSLCHNFVHVIFITRGEFWIGTQEGLSRFSPETETFRNFGEKEGLVGGAIMSILEDLSGCLWIGSSRGLCRFDPAKGLFNSYDITDGLPSNAFLRNAALKRKQDGRMIFSTIDGLAGFQPGEVKDNPLVPEIVLTSVKVFNEELLPDRLRRRISDLRLPYDKNFISFEFAALDFTWPEKNRYKYMMEGLDTDWVSSGKRRFANYINLPPGKYVFRVKGSNSDNVWNEQGTALNLVINPPFWAAWWFRIAAGVLLMLLIFVSYRARVNTIKRRNRELSEANSRLEEQIEKRQQAETAVQESRERLNSVIEHSPVVLWAVDKSGIFTFSEGRGLESLGLKPGEVVGLSLFELYSDQPEIIDAARRALAGETVSIPATVGDIYFETRWTPLKNNDGHVTGVIGLALDESKRKHMEEERNMLTEQLRHVQKLETIGTLAGGIAHDFNNILGPILGYTEMALEEISEDHIAAKWLASVVEASQRARDLVQQILVFGRRSRQEFKQISISLVIKEALKLVRASFPATVEIHQDICEDCPPVLADATQIHQIFMNLCANSRHAMGENGTLSVELKTEEIGQSAAKLHANLKQGLYVRLKVGDTGHGMDPVTLKRLFEPFYTTKKPGEGTGMGLSVVHGIVMAHGGDITAVSEPGKGAEFTVYLPASTPDKAADKTVSIGQIAGGSERIILVDDEESMTVMAKLMLEQLGYHVTAFTGSPKALEYIIKHRDRVDLVIADQTMPLMTGVELTQKIKKQFPDLPVIIVSGFSETVNHKNYAAFGLSAYVSKPFNATRLGHELRRVLDQQNQQ